MQLTPTKALHKLNLTGDRAMLHQNSITTCLLLLQQQTSLQHELNRYCELIFYLDPILDLLNLPVVENNVSLTSNLSRVIEALIQAQAVNKIIVKELQNHIDSTARKQ